MSNEAFVPPALSIDYIVNSLGFYEQTLLNTSKDDKNALHAAYLDLEENLAKMLIFKYGITSYKSFKDLRSSINHSIPSRNVYSSLQIIEYASFNIQKKLLSGDYTDLIFKEILAIDKQLNDFKKNQNNESELADFLLQNAKNCIDYFAYLFEQSFINYLNFSFDNIDNAKSHLKMKQLKLGNHGLIYLFNFGITQHKGRFIKDC